jgi:alpha-L-rhamnosidase
VYLPGWLLTFQSTANRWAKRPMCLLCVGMSLCCFIFIPNTAAGAEKNQTIIMKKEQERTRELLNRDLSPGHLRCEYLVNPLGIDMPRPRLSWLVESSQRAQQQTAYRILVARTKAGLDADKGDLWDSGMIESDETIQIDYGGKPLQSGIQCFWKVRVRDAEGLESGWSDPAFWTMGLLKDTDWTATWIGMDKVTPRSPGYRDLNNAHWIWYPEGTPAQNASPGTRYFREGFTLPENRKIESGRCMIAADNRFTLFINGGKAAEGSSNKMAMSTDITKHLRTGSNILAVEAINEGDTGNPAGLLATFRFQFDQGSPLVIVTDEKWKVEIDPLKGWKTAAFHDRAWSNAMTLGKSGCKPWGDVSTDELYLPPSRYLRKEFNIKNPIRRATVYASALGLYELHLNGKRVGEDYFTPGWTDYDTRVYYNTYDVTGMLAGRENVIGAILADGWYSGYVGWNRIREHSGDKPRFRAQLHLEYEDGNREIIATGRSWKVSTGPLLEADFLMGESYDARMELPGWDAPGFDDKAWQQANVTSTIKAKTEAYPGVTVQKFQEIIPVKITEPRKGRFIFDLGTNFAGFVRLKVKGQRGRKVVLRFAERLNPDGTIYTENLRDARVTDTYICRGGGREETWHPRFTFHGFQYVEVTGYPGQPGTEALTGIELTSNTPVAGDFSCSDRIANQLYRNICQTQRSNFIDIPTDCPQRDERLGWTGDAQIYVRTATCNNDVAAFFTKWLVDLDDAQFPDGGFPDVAPRETHEGHGVAAWADAGVICPWTIYNVYHDERVLMGHYDAMKGWIAYCRENSEGLLRPATGYGDWLSINADTPKDVLATAYFAYSTKLVARTAEVIGRKKDAEKYHRLHEQIKEAFNQAYVSGDGRIKGETQTVYVLALRFGLLSDAIQPLAVQHLIDDIKAKDWHLSTGFVGTKDLMSVLTDYGYTDVAYRLFHNKSFPSWGFSIQHGATSIWERWDGWTPEMGFQNPGMNSFAHYSFGAVGEWMFRTVAGIDTDGPGFRNIIIRPSPGGRLKWCKAKYDSIRGPIRTHWETANGGFHLDVSIPANTTARVHIPTSNPGSVMESNVPAETSEGVSFMQSGDGVEVYRIQSGRYRFTSHLE